jgi:hypothetical protein
MKSPFPGMDPYIEVSDLWEDFHDNLIVDIQRALAPVLPQGYVARTGKRCYVVLAETEGKDKHSFVPDVSVSTKERRGARAAKGSGTALASAAASGEARSMRAFIATDGLCFAPGDDGAGTATCAVKAGEKACLAQDGAGSDVECFSPCVPPSNR